MWLNLDWDYQTRTVRLSMTGYIQAALQQFNHIPPAQPDHVPYKYLNPMYSRQPAEPIPEVISVPLQPPQITTLHNSSEHYYTLLEQ